MKAILPGTTFGVVGGGQLGMMILREAQRMGYRTCVWDPSPDCPAGRLADVRIVAPYTDPDALNTFASTVHAATYEFENIDAAPIRTLESKVTLAPGSKLLSIAQHRLVEKNALQKGGFPTVKFVEADSAERIREAVKSIGLPVVIKTATSGYDGKGQAVVKSSEALENFLNALAPPLERSEIPPPPSEGGGWGVVAAASKSPGVVASVHYIIEQFIDLACEVSVIVVRGRDGEMAAYPVGENEHRENILHITRVPARISDDLQKKASELGRSVAEYFGLVGVLCVEMFVTKNGEILVNELAPRPHNSGHYSLDACTVSQFESVIRAVCGLPLVAPRLLSPCAMINILGKHLQRLDETNTQALLRLDGVKLHLYGKRRVEPKRKMGHITVLGPSAEGVETQLRKVEGITGR
jgi:5-(carboxyamino)imidazole ribonucleotide synthase